MDAQAVRNDTEAMVREYLRTRDDRLRSEVIERHQALVRSLAHKFVRPGVCVDDLIQAAWIALIRALDRYDPGRDTRFSTYAVHCIVGEIKRYFRDQTWALNVPRQLREIAANLYRVQEQLYRKLHREPTVSEMAQAFGVTDEVLLQAMEVGHAYQPRGLDERSVGEDGNDTTPLEERLGGGDDDMERMVEHAPLYAAIATLDERDQAILRRRFFDGWSQQEVADELGVSQMHISRLERAALKRLRERIEA